MWNLLFDHVHRAGVSRKALTPPIYLRIRSSKAFVISACVLAIFTDTFLYGMVSQSKPEQMINNRRVIRSCRSYLLR
jgi:hypothetical protein